VNAFLRISTARTKCHASTFAGLAAVVPARTVRARTHPGVRAARRRRSLGRTTTRGSPRAPVSCRFVASVPPHGLRRLAVPTRNSRARSRTLVEPFVATVACGPARIIRQSLDAPRARHLSTRAASRAPRRVGTPVTQRSFAQQVPRTARTSRPDPALRGTVIDLGPDHDARLRAIRSVPRTGTISVLEPHVRLTQVAIWSGCSARSADRRRHRLPVLIDANRDQSNSPAR
jgi:hypothetical protein